MACFKKFSVYFPSTQLELKEQISANPKTAGKRQVEVLLGGQDDPEIALLGTVFKFNFKE